MKGKQLTILVVVCAILGVAGWVIYNKRNGGDSDSTEGGGRKVYKNFPLNDVENISIAQGNAKLNLAKQNDVWTVQERNNYLANFGSISEFLRKVWELKVAQPVEAGESQLSRLEMLPPDKGVNSGTLVEFKDKSGKNLNTLMLGKKHMRKGGDDSGMGGGGFPDGRYIMADNDIKSLAVVNDALSNIEPKPEEWLNKDFFKVENLKAISVTSTNTTNNWKLEREKEGSEWKLTDAKPGESLDTGKSSGVTSALSAPSFNDVATNTAPDKTGLDKPLLAKLTTFDGFNYDVKVGAKTGEDNYFMQVAVNASLPKERTAGKDEKPEEKTKLDKEFKEKNDKLQEKLKAEKEYEKWTYVVSKWTIDPLFKERKDLLAEKKAEPKSDSATNAPAAKPVTLNSSSNKASPPKLPPLPPKTEAKISAGTNSAAKPADSAPAK